MVPIIAWKPDRHRVSEIDRSQKMPRRVHDLQLLAKVQMTRGNLRPHDVAEAFHRLAPGGVQIDMNAAFLVKDISIGPSLMKKISPHAPFPIATHSLPPFSTRSEPRH